MLSVSALRGVLASWGLRFTAFFVGGFLVWGTSTIEILVEPLKAGSRMSRLDMN